MVGPEPTREALRAAAGSDDALRAWAARWTGMAPVLWNTVHLVVTGVTPTHALLVALDHLNEYPDEDLEELGAAAAGDAVALEATFTEATGTPPRAARPWLPRRKEQGPASTPEASAADSRPQGKTMTTRIADIIGADPEESSKTGTGM